MKKLLLLVAMITLSIAQSDLTARGTFMPNGADYIGGGIDYKLAQVGNLPLYGTANLLLATNTRVIELGSTLKFDIKSVANLSLRGGGLLSFTNVSFGGFSSNDTDFTLFVGAEYYVAKTISLGLDLGLTGVDDIRLQLGFSL